MQQSQIYRFSITLQNTPCINKTLTVMLYTIYILPSHELGQAECVPRPLLYARYLCSRAHSAYAAARLVCKIPLLARRTRPKGRPSAARDDRVSCIQPLGQLYTRYLIVARRAWPAGCARRWGILKLNTKAASASASKSILHTNSIAKIDTYRFSQHIQFLCLQSFCI